MLFIGDVHAKFREYLEIVAQHPQSIQVGDFGVGFAPVPQVPEGHRFIRGNHDDPQGCREQPRWIPDAHHEDGMFFLGGGESIDRYLRTPGVDWWPDEELGMGELYEAMDLYAEVKPRILVSHECPSDYAGLLFSHYVGRIENPSRTSQALGSMLWIHKPEIVLFGHWHHRVDRVIDGIRFICLEELGTIEIDL